MSYFNNLNAVTVKKEYFEEQLAFLNSEQINCRFLTVFLAS